MRAGIPAAVPEHCIDRLRLLLAHKPDASDAQCARFIDFSASDWHYHYHCTPKFRAAVLLTRFAVAAQAIDQLPPCDDEPLPFSAFHFVAPH